MQNWDINKTQYKVSDFVSWQRAKSLNLSPSFQRRPVWKPGAKSYLIDTVVRGLPIPIIFLREKVSSISTLEPKREVVDGQQRIRTLFSYIDKSLLKDYKPQRDFFVISADHNPDLAGKEFRGLPQQIRQKILDYQFSVHVLPAKTDDREVLEIFARMNATGVKLNSQELRNAEWFGDFKTSMYELASKQLQRWREWKIFSEDNIARMEEVEIVSEFAQMALKGITHKTQSSLDKLYEDFDNDFPNRKEFERRFQMVMDYIDDHLGPEMPRLAFHRKTLFYSLFALVYDLLFGLRSALIRKRPGKIRQGTLTWVKTASTKIENETAPQKVLNAVARRTTHLISRQRLFEYLSRGN